MFSRIYYRIQQFFGVSKSEARGIILLFVVISISLLAPVVIWQISFGSQPEITEQRQLDSLMALMKSSFYTPSDSLLFEFDPNYISEDSLIMLNFQPSVARRIIHYRDKGGKFRYKEALYKIYGISSINIFRVYDYILLPDSATYFQRIHRQSTGKFKPFDINRAVEQDLLPIRGIGHVFASRIIKYRNLLGGYASKEQYAEVYQLDDETIARLKKATFIRNDFSPRKIRVNHADFDDLWRHPYISKTLAKEIDTFRKHEGTITDVTTLYKFEKADSSIIEKLEPYLDFN